MPGSSTFNVIAAVRLPPSSNDAWVARSHEPNDPCPVFHENNLIIAIGPSLKPV